MQKTGEGVETLATWAGVSYSTLNRIRLGKVKSTSHNQSLKAVASLLTKDLGYEVEWRYLVPKRLRGAVK
jgi:hypothetical protein